MKITRFTAPESTCKKYAIEWFHRRWIHALGKPWDGGDWGYALELSWGFRRVQFFWPIEYLGKV